MNLEVTLHMNAAYCGKLVLQSRNVLIFLFLLCMGFQLIARLLLLTDTEPAYALYNAGFDGVVDLNDIDDNNVGILYTDECDLSVSSYNAVFTGLSTAGGTFNTDDASNRLFTIDVGASSFTPGTDDDNSYNVSTATGNSTTGLRYEEGADGTIGSTISNSISFAHAIPVEIRAGATYGGVNSIMNRAGDRFVWEATGTSDGFSWVIHNADFPGGGGSATVSGDGKTLTIEAGAGTGSANQAQFYVSTNGRLKGINVRMETIATLTGVINAAQFSLRTPILCDADGDGIDNINDLDDDNDGILDVEECGIESSGASWTLFFIRSKL